MVNMERGRSHGEGGDRRCTMVIFMAIVARVEILSAVMVLMDMISRLTDRLKMLGGGLPLCFRREE